MRNYEYSRKWQKLLTPEIVNNLTLIHEYKIEQRLTVEKYTDVLADLSEIVKVQGTESSNRMEGICISEVQLKKIVLGKTMPRSKDEQEIAGYCDVSNIIYDNYDHIPVRASFVLQLHHDLYKFKGDSIGGRYRNTDNIISEGRGKEEELVNFHAVPAVEISQAVDSLCEAYEEMIVDIKADPLLIIPMFVLDFLCIHPFQKGNGRMSRLLTLLLLYRAGYTIGQYVSLDMLIEKSKNEYHNAIANSSLDWQTEENDYFPFVKYMLDVILKAYIEFFERTKQITHGKIPKPDRIAEEIKNHTGTITKAELVTIVPDVSQTTVQRTLNDLLKEGKIIKLGGGRYTRYKWIWEDENK